MDRIFIIVLLLGMAICVGCRTDANESIGDCRLPEMLGGIEKEFLIYQKEGCSTMEIEFDEIILSNDEAVFTGRFVGPSNSVKKSNKSQMNLLNRLPNETTIKYLIKSITAVRFNDCDYGYPYEDFSWINIKGTGECKLRVVSGAGEGWRARHESAAEVR